MGDIANMTDCDGRVNGFRMLRWLRSREEMHREAARDCRCQADQVQYAWQRGRADLLCEIADDLEAEINPPDYPDDDDDDDDMDDGDAGPCDGCGKMADRVSVSDNGRVWLACPACAARVDDDTVDLDDPAMTDGPEEERQT